MSPANYDIAIVGFGPVGAFSALLLAEAGLRVAILERSREAVELPRAVALDGESVRAFQRIGRGDAVAALLQAPREKDEMCFADSKHTPLFGVEIPKLGANGWRDVAFFDQPELEAYLRDEVAQHERVDVFLGHQVVAIEQGERDVVLRSTPDTEAGQGSPGAEIRAAYAIGCDGASSFVRDAMGIEWRSLGYDQEWLVVDVIQGPKANLPLKTLQVCDPARLSTYVCVKDPNRRWEFQLLKGETHEEMLRPERIQALLDPWVAREHYEIRRAAVYQFHAATASRWRVGRVLLAGDSAHQTPPFLGQGLNAGFRDAVNLAWKLPLVLAGVCGESMLDSYAAERDAHARDLVEWAVAIGKLMETLAAREAGLPDPHVAQQSAGYGQGRTAPPLRAGILIESQTGGDRPAGRLLRQPTVRDAIGTERRLDELIGPGFAVIGRNARDLQLGPKASALFGRMGGRVVGLEGLDVVSGAPDVIFDQHSAALIRPDRYIFGVVDKDWDLDRLVAELARKLAFL